MLERSYGVRVLGIPLTERGIPSTVLGIPLTERGIPSTVLGIPLTECGISSTARKVPWGHRVRKEWTVPQDLKALKALKVQWAKSAPWT